MKIIKIFIATSVICLLIGLWPIGIPLLSASVISLILIKIIDKRIDRHEKQKNYINNTLDDIERDIWNAKKREREEA